MGSRCPLVPFPHFLRLAVKRLPGTVRPSIPSTAAANADRFASGTEGSAFSSLLELVRYCVITLEWTGELICSSYPLNLYPL